VPQTKEEKRKYDRQYYKKNAEKLRAQSALYVKNNKEKTDEYQQNYREENRETLRAKNRVYKVSYRENDPVLWRRRNMFYAAKHRAKKLDLPFTITLDDIPGPTHCPALAIELNYSPCQGKVGDDSPTLDRFDPAQGYVAGNVSVISSRANRMKSNADTVEVRALLRWMEANDDNDQT